MNSSKTLLALFASLLPLSTVACGGSTGASDPSFSQAPAPSASSSSSSQDDAGAPNPNGGQATTDAGTTGNTDAGTTTTVASNCNVSLVEPDLCIENVSGHAGQIVDVPIDFIGTSTCTDAYEGWGHLVLDANYFTLTNPVQQVDCISRDLYSAPAPGTTEVMWDAFGGGSISACPNNIVPGRLDQVKIEILPGTPAGDYDVTWLNAGLAAPSGACSMSGGGIKGTIHVD